MLVTTPGDYTVMISKLSHAFKIFLKKINKINKIIIEENQNIQEMNINEGEIKPKERNVLITQKQNIKKNEIFDLGLEEFPQDKEINIYEGFNAFIKNRICISSDGQKYNVSQINICYKMDKLKKIEDKIQDKKSKILKINHDPKQQLKNNKLNLKDNERKYCS